MNIKYLTIALTVLAVQLVVIWTNPALNGPSFVIGFLCMPLVLGIIPAPDKTLATAIARVVLIVISVFEIVVISYINHWHIDSYSFLGGFLTLFTSLILIKATKQET